MDLKKLFRFIFPELKIIDVIREEGIIQRDPVWEPKKNRFRKGASAGYQASPTVMSQNKFSINSSSNINHPNGQVVSMKPKAKKSPINQPLSGNMHDRSIQRVKSEASKRIIGQNKAVAELLTGFRRQHYNNQNSSRPRNTMLIIGGRNTGKRYLLSQVIITLKEEKFLNREELAILDLSLYPTQAEQRLFLSDLYKAIHGPSEVVLFEQAEKAHSSVIAILENLVTTGIYKLDARYALQNQDLIEATGSLMKDSISEIRANQKYFVFISTASISQVTGALGLKLMKAIGDMIQMEPYDSTNIRRITERFMGLFQEDVRYNFGLFLGYSDGLIIYRVNIVHLTASDPLKNLSSRIFIERFPTFYYSLILTFLIRLYCSISMKK